MDTYREREKREKKREIEKRERQRERERDFIKNKLPAESIPTTENKQTGSKTFFM